MKEKLFKKHANYSPLISLFEQQQTLSTDRCKIKLKTEHDLKQDFRWRQDPLLCALDATKPLNLSFEQYRQIQKQELGLNGTRLLKMSIFTHDDQQIGSSVVYNVNPVIRQAEYGIMIGKQQYWGLGYGTEITKFLVLNLFKLNLFNRLYLHTLANNNRAIGCFLSAGFSKVKHRYRDGYQFLEMETLNDNEVTNT